MNDGYSGTNLATVDLRRNLHALSIATKEMLETRPLKSLKRDSLTPEQLRVLRLVAFNEGVRVGELASALGVKPSSTSLILDRLEGRGYVERFQDADDGRVTRLRTTEAGERLFREAETAIEEKLDTALDSLDEERVAQLNALIGEFLTGLMKGEEFFNSLCFHCGIRASKNCVLGKKYGSCPYQDESDSHSTHPHIQIGLVDG